MDIDQASTFFVSSLLIGLGLVAIAATLTAINNIFSKYWKPVNFGYFLPRALVEQEPIRFAEPHEIHHVDKSNEPKLDLSKHR